MKLATWNVNSLNVRLPRLLAWLAGHAPDVVCLQETKLEDARFPHRELEDAGYAAQASGQKTYNGVAILTRGERVVTDVSVGLRGFDDDQKRLIAATVDGVRVVCAYVPNGQSVDSDKYAYKLRWCEAATATLRDELARHRELAFCGDLNIAPEERDVHDPAAWEGQVLFSAPEREVFARWVALGLEDSFRLFDQPPKTFSWWDYRMLAFPKNRGLRIDHILVSRALASRCRACTIDRGERKGEKPSDHAPVIAEFA
ncbi:MAG: exodeoxyribonuclease III [Burkholderiales bacterium]|nr:exodeoxyribonuclease III [Burkholderiales bacterium]MCE7877279.1 exodeoxyribonuclease III [Betaproteobacteria bacterium PRO3]